MLPWILAFSEGFGKQRGYNILFGFADYNFFLFSKDAPDELQLLSVTIQGQQSLDFHCASCIDLEKLLEVPFIR